MRIYLRMWMCIYRRRACTWAGTAGKRDGNGNGIAANGVANGDAAKEKAKEALKKIDWEIPRKLFHSSIGA